jgi:hypothetical protein
VVFNFQFEHMRCRRHIFQCWLIFTIMIGLEKRPPPNFIMREVCCFCFTICVTISPSILKWLHCKKSIGKKSSIIFFSFVYFFSRGLNKRAIFFVYILITRFTILIVSVTQEQFACISIHFVLFKVFILKG